MTIGFSASEAGIISAIGNFFSLLLQPIVTNIADNNKKFNAFRLGTIISLLILLSCLLLYFQNSASLLVILLFVCVYGFYETVESLTNTVPALFKHKGIDLPYGLCRAFGSASYAIVTYLLGILVVKYGIVAILICEILGGLMMSISFYILKKKYESIKDKNKDENKDKVIPYSAFISRHKTFIILIIAVVGIYYGYTISDNFMVLIVENIGGDASDAGKILGIKAMLEIPIIFFYEKIEKIFSAKKLLFFSVICLAIKAILISISKTTTALLCSQLIQPLSIAFFIPSMVSYTNQIMDKDEAARGQSLSIMAITLASIISSFVAGIIADNYSVSTMLLSGTTVSIISAIVFCITISKKD